MADGITIEQTGLIQVFRSLDLDRKIIVSAEHTVPPTLTITKNHLTTPIGIALSSDGIAYDNGTSISNTTWTTLQNKIASVEAIAPNGGNALLLVVNKEVAIQNADTSPTRVIDTMAGDPTVVGEHFGIEWVGNTKPFIMESLDSTDLQINNTPLVLTDGTDDTTLTKDGLVITNTAGSSTHSFQLLNLLETGVGSCILNPNSILVNSELTGGGSFPILTLSNSNGSGSVAMEVYKNKPTAGLAGDVIFNQRVFGKDNINVKTEYTQITHTIRDGVSPAEDGSIEFLCRRGGNLETFLQINGIENEINVAKSLDMGTSASIVSTAGDINITANASAGTGDVNITAKGDVDITSNGAGGFINMTSVSSIDIEATGDNLTLTGGAVVQIEATGTGADIIIKPETTAGDLVLEGGNIESGSRGGSSGQNLRIKLNGVYYKIQLYDDV